MKKLCSTSKIYNNNNKTSNNISQKPGWRFFSNNGFNTICVFDHLHSILQTKLQTIHIGRSDSIIPRLHYIAQYTSNWDLSHISVGAARRSDWTNFDIENTYIDVVTSIESAGWLVAWLGWFAFRYS